MNEKNIIGSGVVCTDADFWFCRCGRNDGDLDTPGQKGWSRWVPRAAVFGKNGDKTGLVTLSPMTAVEPSSKMTTTWGALKD